MALFGKGGMGIEVGQRVLRAVEVRRAGGSHTARWYKNEPLPAGLVIDSFTEPNITDVKAFVEALKRLKTSWPGGRRVSVALPDYTTRVSILDFDTVPGNDEELERMIRWRLKKVLPFDVDEAALRKQYLGKFTRGERTEHRYLVTIIKAVILAQYEQVFREASLRLPWMDIATFAVWNLFHDQILRKADAKAGLALMNISGGKLTVMVFDRSVPHFMRLKDLGKAGDGHEAVIDTTRVLRELIASLTFYKENYADTPVAKVYIAGDIERLEDVADEVRRNSAFEAILLEMGSVVKAHGKAADGQVPSAFAAACGAALEF